MIQRILIAGGGTGGHVYPGVAVAEEVLARNPEAQVLFVGGPTGLENRILPKLGYALETISVSRLKGGGIWGRLKGLFRLPVGIWQSWRVLRRAKPNVVLGVGGYASGPALLAAWLTRRPTAIQEQNATPGLTNRVLGKLVRQVFVGFEAAKARFKPKKTVFTGNPLRRSVADALVETGARPAPAEGALRILIFGGSQGARFLNENVPPLVRALREARPELALTVTHQTGTADEAITRERYAQCGFEVRVTPFIHDMPAAYAAADLAICRAGALTVAELTAVGLPALMVPFPFAADDHQAANAKVLADAGAGRMVRQKDWQRDELVAWLAELSASPDRVVEMSRAAYGLARLDAARTVVDHLEGIAR